jgi:hypothetical protein
MSGAHEGCSQGKSVRDREGSKHSTAATPERVDSEAAVLPQDFEDTVHARQLKALCRRVGRRMSRQGPGRSPSMGLTHLNAARPREKSSGVPHCGSSKILSDLVSHRRATRPTWLMHGSRPQAAWPCACTRSPTLRSHRTCDSTPLLHPLFRSRIPELSFGRPRVAIHEDLDGCGALGISYVRSRSI